MRNIHLLGVVLVLLSTGPASAEVFVFGDSLSDTGNFQISSGGAVPPSPLYSSGRFSNGPVWVEVLAAKLREPSPTASMLGGSNYSFNGARAAGVSPYGVPDVTLQVDLFLAANGNVADPDDLYVIWAGANDIFFGAATGEANFIADAVTAICSSILRLHDAGARKFVVLNLPPLGQTPYFNYQPALSVQFDFATTSFNRALSMALHSLNCSGEDFAVSEVDIERLFGQILNNPRRFQLVNTVDSCTLFDPFGTSLGYQLKPLVEPNAYLFWDGVHPTARGHEIIAKLAYQNVRKHLSGRGRWR